MPSGARQEVARGAAGAGLEQRHIVLDGQSNFRDLGGYVTTDGRTVKRGQVYRSGRLPGLSDHDLIRLEELGVRSVVNFLSSNEIEFGGADRLPQTVEELRMPIDPETGIGSLIDELIAARTSGDFSRVPADVNPEIHRMLMREAREEYAALLRTLANATNRPIVFHCSHGVHRTGTAAAILLMALGVPWETVREDYLLSNECRAEEITTRLAQLRVLCAETQGISEDEVDTTNMEAFYILRGAYIDAALEQAVADHGSMDAYLREGLGLSEAELSQLRRELLEE
jgi:protein-tyrosine phosphatase